MILAYLKGQSVPHQSLGISHAVFLVHILRRMAYMVMILYGYDMIFNHPMYQWIGLREIL